MLDASTELNSDIPRCVGQFCDAQLEARHIIRRWRDGVLM